MAEQLIAKLAKALRNVDQMVAYSEGDPLVVKDIQTLLAEVVDFEKAQKKETTPAPAGGK